MYQRPDPLSQRSTLVQDLQKGATRVVLLGTGTPVPSPARSGPATAVVVGHHAYLVDFGPGVVRRAVEGFDMGIAALDVRWLNHAFSTHLHSDHTVGYPDLILTPWVLGREEPLEVFGPEGIRAMTDHVLEALASGVTGITQPILSLENLQLDFADVNWGSTGPCS